MSVVYPQTERECSFLARTVRPGEKPTMWHARGCFSRQGAAGRNFTRFDIRHSTFDIHSSLGISSFVICVQGVHENFWDAPIEGR